MSIADSMICHVSCQCWILVHSSCSFDTFLIAPREILSDISQWQIRIDRDLQCRAETALSLVDQRNQYDKNYLSFLAGVDLCKRLSGTHSKCHALSFDLSLPCSSREPTCRTDHCIKIHPSFRWQPRLNYPFICQFFHPKKGILKKPALNTNAQFGLATLWRRAKHKFTPKLVRQILTSTRFQNRLELWTIIHALGSNTKARFEQTKMLRSNDGGLTLCYALRRLANNIQEPFLTLSLNAIDASIKWWHGKPAARASALRAPISLTPNLQQQLRKFLRQWHLQILDYQVPCHNPSFKMVFNHKKAIDDWSTSNPAICCCKNWSSYKAAALNPSEPHWVLAGSLPPLHAATRAGCHCRKQSFSFQKGIPQPDATGHEELDETQRLTFHAEHCHL